MISTKWVCRKTRIYFSTHDPGTLCFAYEEEDQIRIAKPSLTDDQQRNKLEIAGVFTRSIGILSGPVHDSLLFYTILICGPLFVHKFLEVARGVYHLLWLNWLDFRQSNDSMSFKLSEWLAGRLYYMGAQCGSWIVRIQRSTLG